MADTFRPTTWRWRLSGPDLPPLIRNVTVGLGSKAMLIRQAKKLYGSDKLPFTLHGPSEPDGRHRHAFFLPEDFDDDGFIDHVTVSASIGFDDKSLRLLGSCEQLIVGNKTNVLRCDLVTVHVGESDAWLAKEWQSFTPFVTPLPLRRSRGGKVRKGRSIVDQLQKLVTERRNEDFSPLPAVTIDTFSWENEDQNFPAAEDFWIGKEKTDRPGEPPERGWFHLVFDEEVEGPLAFGLQEHFGLGRFIPVG